MKSRQLGKPAIAPDRCYFIDQKKHIESKSGNNYESEDDEKSENDDEGENDNKSGDGEEHSDMLLVLDDNLNTASFLTCCPS